MFIDICPPEVRFSRMFIHFSLLYFLGALRTTWLGALWEPFWSPLGRLWQPVVPLREHIRYIWELVGAP